MTFRSDNGYEIEHEYDFHISKASHSQSISFLPVADQQRRMLSEWYSHDRSQPNARDKEFKSRSRTQSHTRSPIWRLLIPGMVQQLWTCEDVQVSEDPQEL